MSCSVGAVELVMLNAFLNIDVVLCSHWLIWKYESSYFANSLVFVHAAF